MAQNEASIDAKKVVVELTMTVEEAQQVKWVGKGPNDPIGNLLQSGQLTKRDLAWAVEGSFNSKCREASRTLLAYWLGQPTTLEATKRFGPEVVSGTNYLKEQEEDKLFEMGFLLGAAYVALVVVVIWLMFSVIPAYLKAVTISQQVAFIIAFLIVLVLPIGVGLYWLKEFKKRRNDYRSFRAGREGEDAIVERLRAILDNRWTVFRNLVLPNRKDDVDLVLVGPGGVWVVQVKSTQSMLRAQGTNWQVHTKSGWVPAAQNPAHEVFSHAKRLNIYLQQQGINRWIECAIALAKEQPISYFEKSEIPVWLPPTIEAQVKSLSVPNPPSEQEIKKIVTILKQLNGRQTNNQK